MPDHLFITGIGTGVGKTITAAVFTQYLQADYWKPVQSGDLEQSDSLTVKELIDGHLMIHPERYRLQLAASPHQSAAQENISISPQNFQLPITTNRLVIEGAGGLLVPLNNNWFVIDLIKSIGCPVVLVAKDYLGCINHSLLSVKTLQQHKIPIACFVFNGPFNPASEQVITQHLPKETNIIHLPLMQPANATTVKQITLTINI